MVDMQQKWDERYRGELVRYPDASWVLQQNRHLLPKQGIAVDLACDLGANALLMASLGLQTQAWDISHEALAKLSAEAKQRRLDVSTQQRDVTLVPPVVNSFDVIVISQFLDRQLCPHLVHALKSDGLIFYQTYCRDKVDNKGPQNSEFLLRDNELLELFSRLKLRVYREESLAGDGSQGWRNQAMLVSQKS